MILDRPIARLGSGMESYIVASLYRSPWLGAFRLILVCIVSVWTTLYT